tara:strand:- start:314 stop:1462 length:1149 start_codon:yes stop_codon:yes gene_type:complete
MYQDKLGVYKIGDLKFYSKLEAIEMHTKTGIHPHWDFNDAVFSSYDWTTEPKENILELYRRRAQQLRDNYDYIIIMYSGGADSTNVLESFLHNDIKVDEIASYSNFQRTGIRDDMLNGEITKVVLPAIERLKNQYPWLTYRLIDMLELELEYFNQENSIEFFLKNNIILNPNASARGSLGLKIKEWANIIHSGKKLAIVWGKDKPRVFHQNGQWYCKFIDFLGDACTVTSIAGEEPYTDELFYWTPDLPEIIIKQAHLIKNYLNSGDTKTLPFVSETKSDIAYKEIEDKKYWLSDHGVHNIIYPNWDIGTYTFGKAQSTIITPRSSAFLNLQDNHVARKNYFMGLTKSWDSTPEYWRNNQLDVSKGIKGSWSKNYYLEKEIK